MSEHQNKEKPVHDDPADATGNRNVPRTTERAIPAEGSFRDAASPGIIDGETELNNQQPGDPGMEGGPEKA